MKNILSILFLIGCSSNTIPVVNIPAPQQQTKQIIVSPNQSCKHSGIYEVSHKVIDGNCPALPRDFIKFETNAAPSIPEFCDGVSMLSPDKCEFISNVSCNDNNFKLKEDGNIIWNYDGSYGKGVMKIEINDDDKHCSGHLSVFAEKIVYKKKVEKY